MREVGLLAPGEETSLRVWRPDARRQLLMRVRLGKWPVEDDSLIVATQRRFAPWRGMEIDYPTARRRYLTSDLMEQYHRAVVVLAVSEGSPAAEAGLRPGDLVTMVNGLTVETPDEFYAVVSSARDDVALTRLDGETIHVAESVQP